MLAELFVVKFSRMPVTVTVPDSRFQTGLLSSEPDLRATRLTLPENVIELMVLVSVTERLSLVGLTVSPIFMVAALMAPPP